MARLLAGAVDLQFVHHIWHLPLMREINEGIRDKHPHGVEHIASCSLSATINKLSRFMDDFARPRRTASRFTRGNVRNLMKRNA